MRLGELVEGLPLAGDAPPELEVRGIQHDSRRVEPGDLFVALVGERFDGRAFVLQAAERGAVAVVAPGPPPAATPLPWLSCDQPRAVLGPLAARVFAHPDREMTMVGVTGTNGKSTTVWIVQALLEAAGRPCGRIGTLAYRFADLDLPAGRTTPEASDLFRLLRRMRERGAAAVAMEVSSHALTMGRVAGVAFDVAAFTNLTQDHLDFHRTMEEYFAAKQRLFGHLEADGTAVVNVDDAFGRRLAAELPRVVTCGRDGMVRVEEAQLSAEGTRATFATPRGRLQVQSRLLGSFNLDNLLLAVGVAEALELPHAAIGDGLAAVEPVPGRLEPVDRGQPFAVFVDYAHSEDALAHALAAVRELVDGRVAVVFGCGGDRDPGKRFPMGRVAGERADLVIVTSDNPRSEDPQAILGAIEEGVKASGNGNYRLIPDRRDAIRRALAIAEPGWAVLVAGKGNESGQEIAGQVFPFSDREEIAAALEGIHG
ncbi:MAG TPA: UDP-N-acetylmuramoyl-L-alanyl-D-glutamate--2,6-diaminopimelate ligase [Thermoanaerobaculia bacterium]|nr:UDP-N-acetylmuramoyl-L-alanyl-D-glutamate--2,6-diaminopimelate ligase [Thermoanaerobaculia bacterium]